MFITKFNLIFITGSIKIDELRLSIFGAIQPNPLAELLNSGDADHQGFWDRFLLIPAAKVHEILGILLLSICKFFLKDHNVDITAQLAGVPEAVKIDIDQYIVQIHKNHLKPRIYQANQAAMDKFLECKTRLNEIDAQSDFG